MACIQWVEERLLRWAATVVVGSGDGYPAVNVLHQSWSPPAPGTTPTPKVGIARDVWETRSALALLHVKLRNALMVRYVMKLPRQDQAERLGCQMDTVDDRVERAQRELAALLTTSSGSFAKSER